MNEPPVKLEEASHANSNQSVLRDKSLNFIYKTLDQFSKETKVEQKIPLPVKESSE